MSKFKPKQAVLVAGFGGSKSGVIESIRGDSAKVRFADDTTRTVPLSKLTAKKQPRVPVRKSLRDALDVPRIILPPAPSVPTECMCPRALSPQPKKNPLRSSAYLAYVRTHPCASCGSRDRIEASHHGKHGTGTKPDDHLAIPLCFNCHRGDSSFHQHGTIQGMTREETDAWIAQIQASELKIWAIKTLGAPEVNRLIVEALLEGMREHALTKDSRKGTVRVRPRDE